MGLTKYKLGELIDYCDIRNTDDILSVDNVKGISTGKQFIETKADLGGVSLSAYKIVKKNQFAYVADTSRRGNKIALAFNRHDDSILISAIYTVFCISKPEIILSDYLFMYFNRPEFDRYARFNSWGSARETFDWEDFCDIEIELPDIATQQKYVDIYNAMLANQQSYERGLDDLKIAFDALVNEHKHKSPSKKVGDILNEIDCRNTDGSISDLRGINIEKQFMPSVANTYNVDLSKYKVIKKGQFAFSGMQTGRDECIRISLCNEDKPFIISPAYSVLEVCDETVLAEYIMMWFLRKEIDRLGWFMSDASIRTNLDMDRFFEIQIPIPEMSIQKSIVEIYDVYNIRKKINEKLKAQIKNICPILIKGSIEDGLKGEA